MSRSERKVHNGALRRYKPYPAYKDSGVEWLGEIPVTWEAERANSFLRYEKIQVDPSVITADSVFHYSIPSVQQTGDGALEPPSNIDSAKLRIVGERLLVSRLNPRKGVVLIASEHDVPTLCSTEFIPFEVRGSDLRWAMYLFLGESTRQRLSAVVRSATRSHQRAEVSEIAKIWHGVPPLPEQCAIAIFLDRETARIDALVAKKERLIELLKEKRTALITHAVTKGLDPTVPMKNSGFEWLGEIPAQWETLELRRLIRKGTSITYGIVQAGPDVEDGIPYIRTSDMAGDAFPRIGYQRASREIDAVYQRSKVVAGDVVLAIRATVGKALEVPDFLEGANLTQGTAKVAPGERLHSPFLLAALQSTSSQQHFAALAKGATFREITLDMLRRFPIPVPPLTDQTAVIRCLDANKEVISALVAKIREAIDRLKELRTALISAAVTGKIDVREEAA